MLLESSYPEFNQEDVAAQYRAERRYLEQLPADQVVYYLNDQPTTAEERLNAVVDIIAGKFY
jgi:hypothetical protein